MANEYNGKIQLASKGILYEGELADRKGVLNVEPWGTPEERLLVSPSLTFTETIDRLVKKCTDCPNDAGELLLIDRWHLFIYMRTLSYGGAYSFPYKCAECGSKQKHSMDLEKDLDVVYGDDEDLLQTLAVERLEEPFHFILPIQEKKIGWRMLRGADELSTAKYSNRAKKRGNKVAGDDDTYVHRMATRIVEIDDNNDPSLLDRMDLVRSLKGRDSLEFREQVSRIDIGIEDTIYPKCGNCGWENEETLPMDKSFFRPER